MQSGKAMVTHQVVISETPFANILDALEAQLGRISAEQLRQIVESSASGDQFVQAIKPFIGPSGFTIFFETDHGLWISRLFEPLKAKLYVLGNPLLAKDMLLQNLAAGLYAPTRLYVYENQQGMTCLAYDKLSDFVAHFQNSAISAVAELVDQKLEALIALGTQSQAEV